MDEVWSVKWHECSGERIRDTDAFRGRSDGPRD